MGLRSFGVEEELLLVDADGKVPRAMSTAVLRHARANGESLHHRLASGWIDSELQRQQVEVCTPPCTTLDELSRHVRARRTVAAQAARAAGVRIVALATCPVAVCPSLTPYDRYRRMADEYARVTEEQLICGCHVHVQVSSPDEGVGVLDRIQPWLPPLLALSANSPFWQGRDTGYESWRRQVWARWPSNGPTEPFGTAERYRRVVRTMIETGTLLDEGMVYFDARLSRRYPTVEIRVPDVCLIADDTVLVAALTRGLVETAAREHRAGVPPAPVRTELLRSAMWRAGRSGLGGTLVHPGTWRPAPVETVVRALVEHVRPALEDAGDMADVRDLLKAPARRGNGARLQRAAYARTGRTAGVVADAVERTMDF
ncbi:carboxylate-amine ligase [Thermomonospora echinospora]|uniref:Putative glutamate--cysteine ligase 2 n=1 Tax=Thermomonospora echinospora TaxID=1992 RepID=A0A1H6BPV6_9ACTN|nr:glutamate--cysteine ligase [Thermomonospora echinospora]SEG62662.1 carboxylate-amine ligase [Thermomonospora echinospora]